MDGGVTASRDSRKILVASAIAVMCIAYGLLIGPGSVAHYDHEVFADTIAHQQEGAGYYDAYFDAFAERGVELDEFRSVRQPGIFVLWRWIPADFLWPLYLGLVAFGVPVAMLWVTRTPLAAVPVAAYLLGSARIPSNSIVEQWLLVELWTLIPLSISLVAWTSRRYAVAAGAGAAAFLIREISALYLLVGLVLAWRTGDRHARRSWMVAVSAAVVGYGLHVAHVVSRLAETGNEAVVLGTGAAPRTVWEMMAWMVPGPALVGVVVCLVAIGRILSSRRDLMPLLGLFAVGLGGVFVARPYWGFVFVPFAILLAGEQLGMAVARVRQRVVEDARRSVPLIDATTG